MSLRGQHKITVNISQCVITITELDFYKKFCEKIYVGFSMAKAKRKNLLLLLLLIRVMNSGMKSEYTDGNSNGANVQLLTEIVKFAIKEFLLPYPSCLFVLSKCNIIFDNTRHNIALFFKLLYKIHWSEQMAEEGSALPLSEQLRLAKDMGYSDEEIMQAISMNCSKDGVWISYRAFSSTNVMIDMLARVQKMCETAECADSRSGIGKFAKNQHEIQSANGIDIDLDQSACIRDSPQLVPSSSAIRRAVSFHSPSSAICKSPDTMSTSLHEYRSTLPQFQLQRLLDAFEKEQKSFNDESTRSIRALEVNSTLGIITNLSDIFL
ncbi:unnamed protein product [Thelazia callipaeda]|uniref:SEC7 domain-containing protein n=1 Tax=Thelazia callipaeda TaxID=103827 RepID=A0A0N5CRN2_THECL|nr:unnamed protein product [Thelazia callipaeda]